MITNKRKSVILSIAACLVFSACNFPGIKAQPTKTTQADEGQSVLQTAVAKVNAGLTQAVSVGKPTVAQAKTKTPAPISNPTAGPTQKPVSNNPGTDAATLAGETIPDDSKFLPGTSITKTWRLMNSGSSTWSTDYKLVFVNGDQMGANTEYRIPVPVEPGKIIDMSIQMKAPDIAGNYKGNWKIKNPAGNVFGPGGTGSFWVKIVVNVATATLTSQPTITPTLTSLPATPTVEPTQG
jgi:hypothetical protein